MSSIVSRRPPLSASTSQSKDFFWMSIRLGTSRTLSRRAKLRRVRVAASAAAKTATPKGRTDERLALAAKSATSQDSKAGGCLHWRLADAHGPHPGSRVCGAVIVTSGGYGYWPALRSVAMGVAGSGGGGGGGGKGGYEGGARAGTAGRRPLSCPVGTPSPKPRTV